MTAFHSQKTDFGVGGAYFWNFGGQADKNTLDSYLLGGLNLSRINANFGLITTGYWWESLFDALAIATLVIGINMLATSVESALDQS